MTSWLPKHQARSSERRGCCRSEGGGRTNRGEIKGWDAGSARLRPRGWPAPPWAGTAPVWSSISQRPGASCIAHKTVDRLCWVWSGRRRKMLLHLSWTVTRPLVPNRDPFNYVISTVFDKTLGIVAAWRMTWSHVNNCNTSVYCNRAERWDMSRSQAKCNILRRPVSTPTQPLPPFGSWRSLEPPNFKASKNDLGLIEPCPICLSRSETQLGAWSSSAQLQVSASSNWPRLDQRRKDM